MVGFLWYCYQFFQCWDEVVGDGVVDVVIGQFKDVFCGVVFVGVGFQDVVIDVYGFEFIDQYCQLFVLWVGYQMLDQCGFVCVQKVGDDGYGGFGQVGYVLFNWRNVC